MSRARSMIGFVNRYVSLAGRSCCAGRSWVGLDRSLARRAGNPAARSGEASSCAAADGPAQPAGAAGPSRQPDDVAASSPARR